MYLLLLRFSKIRLNQYPSPLCKLDDYIIFKFLLPQTLFNSLANEKIYEHFWSLIWEGDSDCDYTKKQTPKCRKHKENLKQQKKIIQIVNIRRSRNQFIHFAFYVRTRQFLTLSLSFSLSSDFPLFLLLLCIAILRFVPIFTTHTNFFVASEYLCVFLSFIIS